LLGSVIPTQLRPAALTAIKAIHTVIFASIGAAIAPFVWDGARQRPGRRAAYALGLALGETAIYVSNNQVCPLMPLAEDLRAERGSVADMLPPGVGGVEHPAHRHARARGRHRPERPGDVQPQQPQARGGTPQSRP
jgi:hypothetical protein